MENKGITSRLILMNFLEFAIWGAYLTSMGSYLATAGLGTKIGIFYAMQGIVSIFMPTLIGIIADRWIPAQKVLSACHGIGGVFMLAAGFYAMHIGNTAGVINGGTLLALYSVSVAFFMPTIALTNTVAYSILQNNNKDPEKAFPPIRVFGTVGFICSMLFVNFAKNSAGLQYQTTYNQFLVSGAISIAFCIYALTLPNCPVNKTGKATNFLEASGLKAFKLLKDKQMAIFFIFSMLLGVALQITNGFANPFISSFKDQAQFATSWGANNANALISLSQISETLCILLIPIFLKKFGIKKVMLISMTAWVLRFGLFGAGDPGSKVWMFVLSMIVYGMAFDFFNISGSLYVNKRTESSIQATAQGLFMLMTNGLGATLGTLGAQLVVNHFVYNSETTNWSAAWYIFSCYSLVVTIVFCILFKDPGQNPEKLSID